MPGELAELRQLVAHQQATQREREHALLEKRVAAEGVGGGQPCPFRADVRHVRLIPSIFLFFCVC